MGRPRVFISYTGRDDISVPLRDAVKADLEGGDPADAQHDVFIDALRLQVGAPWRDALYAWLGHCDVAILLLTPAAVGLAHTGSDRPLWVPREVTILSWRKRLDPRLLLVPVLCDGLRLDDLPGSEVAELEIEDRHLILQQEGESRTDLARRIGDVVRGAVVDRGTSCCDALVGSLVKVLRNLQGSRALEALADEIPIDLGPWAPTRDAELPVALGLLHQPFDVVERAIRCLLDNVRERELLVEVVRALQPSWVAWEAAVPLRSGIETQAADASPELYILPGSTPFAAECYVARASGATPRNRWRIVQPVRPKGESDAGMFAERVVAELWKALVPSMPGGGAPELLAGVIDRLKPVFVALEWGPGVVDLGRDLMSRFPGLRVILRVGGSAWQLEPVDGVRPVTLIPELDGAAEQAAHIDYLSLLAILDGGT